MDDDDDDDEDMDQMVPDEMEYTHEDSFKYRELVRQRDALRQQRQNASFQQYQPENNRNDGNLFLSINSGTSGMRGSHRSQP